MQDPVLQVRLMRQSEGVALGLMQPGSWSLAESLASGSARELEPNCRPPVHSVRSRPEVSGMPAFGRYLLACR